MSRQSLFPWKAKLSRNLYAARAYSDVLQGWDDRQTGRIQLTRFQAVWEDCITDVPYYRNLVARHAAPERISSWEDFRAIPELDRGTFQAHTRDFIRLSGPPDLSQITGGSTGVPIRFGIWKAEGEVLRVLKLVLWLRMGYSRESRLFLIWGHAHLLGTGWRRLWNHALRKAKDRLAGYRRVDAYSLCPERCRAIARKIMTFRPAGIIGYASALDYFLRTTESFHLDFQKLGVRFVMPCAEPAPKPDSFDRLRAVFRCPVVQEFGGVDFGQVGMKVDDQPFEVFPEHNILEAAPEADAASARGAAVVTTLYRRYTPLIRYREGDVLGGVKRLPHGHVPRFDSLEGRINDMVELSDGSRVHSVAFLHCVHEEPSVLNAQLVIEDSGASLRLVAADSWNITCETRIRHRLGQLSPSLAGIPLQKVADLETTVAGKRRWFVDKRSRHDLPA